MAYSPEIVEATIVLEKIGGLLRISGKTGTNKTRI
jgi:hypothetical protein